jgi:hypothetical protein
MNRLPTLILMIAFLTGVSFGASPLDKQWFIGFPVQFHERRGFLEFDRDHVQEQGKGNMVTIGALLGKRFLLCNGYRLQVSASVHYGASIDDTLPSIVVGDTALPTQMLSVFFHGSMVADLQHPMTVSPDASWYWHIGYGAHYAELSEYETLNNDPKLRVNDEYLETNRMWSGSIHAGLGFEIAITPIFGFAASYTFRYWHPVHYGMVRDLFLFRPVDYRERFLSHEIDFILLVKRY